MADFNLFLPTLLKHEGGFVDHPLDPGGATNLGITMRTFRQHAKRLLGIEPTLENLKKLTPAEAGILYKDVFWDRVMGDEHPQEFANFLFDFHVNAGGNAVKVLQRVLNKMKADEAKGSSRPDKTPAEELQVDGVMGPGTMRCIQSVNHAKLYNAFKAARIQYYKDLKNPTFEAGWLTRAKSFPDLPETEDV